MAEKRKPSLDSVLANESSKGFNEIDNFTDRVTRYSDAKARQLQILNHVRGLSQGEKSNIALHSYLDFEKLQSQLGGCGNYLVFNQYYTVGQVRLAKASFCKNHLLCQLCAIRRGAKQVGAYMDRCETIEAKNKNLKPYLLTLTVKNGTDLAERFEHLQTSVKKMLKRRRDFLSSGNGQSQLSKVHGGVFSYELTKKSKEWHPHVHMVIYMDPNDPLDFPFDARPHKFSPDEWSTLTPAQKKFEKQKWQNWGEVASQSELSKEWQRITGDSKIVDLRPISQDRASGLVEVFKYALKFSDLKPEENITAYSYLKGKRLTGSFGNLWGVKVPEKMTDELLEDLPYVELFYKYSKAGYSLETATPKEGGLLTNEKMQRKINNIEKAEIELVNPKFIERKSIFNTHRHLKSIIETVAAIHTDPNYEGIRREPVPRGDTLSHHNLSLSSEKLQAEPERRAPNDKDDINLE